MINQISNEKWLTTAEAMQRLPFTMKRNLFYKVLADGVVKSKKFKGTRLVYVSEQSLNEWLKD